MHNRFITASAARKFLTDNTEEARMIDELWEAKQMGNISAINEARERVIFNDLVQVYYIVFGEKP